MKLKPKYCCGFRLNTEQTFPTVNCDGYEDGQLRGSEDPMLSSTAVSASFELPESAPLPNAVNDGKQ